MGRARPSKLEVAGRYALQEVLGRSATAVVWKAVDRFDDRVVVLKWLRREALRVGVRREAALLRLLRVPGVVTLRDDGVARGRAYVVLDFVDGGPFAERGHRTPWSDLVGRLRALLVVLARVHSLGVIHRDIKPSNVLVRGDEVTLIDFGISAARALDDPSAPPPRWSTAAFMAPEVWKGYDSAQSDLYSVAVMAYLSLTDRFPFAVRGDVQRLALDRAVDRPRLRWNLSVDVPREARSVLEAMLSPDPASRPRSATEVLAQLRVADTPAPDARAAGSVDARDDLSWARRQRGLLAQERETSLRESAPSQPACCAPSLRPLSSDAIQLVDVLRLADTPIRASAASRVIRWGPRRTTRALSECMQGGVATREARLIALTPLASNVEPSATPSHRRKVMHRIALALPRGTQRRFELLVAAAQSPTDLAADAIRLASTQAIRGMLSDAENTLVIAVRALRSQAENMPIDELLLLWLRVALEQWTPLAFDRLLYELESHPDARATWCAALARAGLATLHWTPKALEIATSVPPTDRLDRALLRMEFVVLAAQRASKRALRTHLEAVASAAPSSWGRDLARWNGRLAYSEGRFRDAARLCLRAARGERWVGRRLRTLLVAAASLIEVCEFDRAQACARAVLADATTRELRAIYGRARWIERVARWRSGVVDSPDLALADELHSLDPELARLVAIHEATLAWHSREVALFSAFGELASRCEGHTTELLGRSLLEAMAVDLGLSSMSHDERLRRIAALRERVPSIALQFAALTRGDAEPSAGDLRVFEEMARTVPSALWSSRLDILSVDECLSRCGVMDA